MRKRSNPAPSPSAAPADDKALIQNLIGLGDFSARKSYYPELQGKIDELEQEKERYEWLFENALHGIFQAEIDGAINSANPAIATICGYESADTFLAAIDDIGYQLFSHFEDYQRLTKILFETGKRVGFETQFKTWDGGVVEISMNVLLKSREPAIIEAFVQDITERKKAQDSLTRLNENLEMRVQQRTEELSNVNVHLRQEISERKEVEEALKEAKYEAEQANQSKDKYLAAASHDLLQPLNAARLLVSTLQERALAERDHTLVERIHVALLGAEELLTDLLDISKLDANAVSADYCDFPISVLLDSLQTEFKPVAKNAGLQLKVVNSNTIVRSDSRLLMRIIRNLLSNAIRYTEKGRILLGCRRHGKHLRVSVYDTGPGIPEDRQEEIFQEFRQLDNAQTSRDKGVGLGLAIVERISNMLDHPVHLRSKTGHGSCFAVDVPIGSRGVFEKPTANVIALPGQISGLNVLVIDNEEAITHSMQMLLQEWGVEAATALDGDQAVAACKAQKPDIILADYHLANDITGLDVLDRIEEQLGTSIPAIMITADRSDEVRQQFQARGLQRLNKPVKPGKLRSLISHLLLNQ